ncbi:alveolin domain containing intermediate filament IMC15 [Besnoitia besnoiti]|uniref:Alveolin domain containing intermediate filament IMC15 n=1 Tax=Besnoitia besnoiti TaxID=94643 RepID=A0A2A9M4A9_BESBE|nr:alveolin domain containing intermediate filament IMC15 [Besnoitia besnoiti]PFH31141.1 alveolin domain containing intermediate filament IMC15 [Besnoitia besnoiti]
MGTILIEPHTRGPSSRHQAPPVRYTQTLRRHSGVAESSEAARCWPSCGLQRDSTPRDFLPEPPEPAAPRSYGSRPLSSEHFGGACAASCSPADEAAPSRPACAAPRPQPGGLLPAGKPQVYVRPVRYSQQQFGPCEEDPQLPATFSRKMSGGIGLQTSQPTHVPQVRIYGGVRDLIGPNDPTPPLTPVTEPPAPPARSHASTSHAECGPFPWNSTAPPTASSRSPAVARGRSDEAPPTAPDTPWRDYSRAQSSQTVVEQKMVNEGYDRYECMVPRLRPVSVVEKRVEVPVVKTVDTIVHTQQIEERIRFVDKPVIQEVEKFVEVPQIIYNDVIVEVPEVIEVIKRVPKEEIRENITYVPRFETKVIPKYVDVPIVKIVDRYEEVQEIQEVLKPVPKVTVVDVPREVTRIVPNYLIHKTRREVPVPVIQYKEVPRYKTRYEPKIIHETIVNHIPEYHDVEVPYEVPKVEVVDQPYFVTKYCDHRYPVPVSQSVKPVMVPGAHTQVVDVPVQKPYIVTHDKFELRPPIPELLPGAAALHGVQKLDRGRLTAEQKANLARSTSPYPPPEADSYAWTEEDPSPPAPHARVPARPRRPRKFFAGMHRPSSCHEARWCDGPDGPPYAGGGYDRAGGDYAAYGESNWIPYPN